jgi:hypothetical protein
MRSGRRDAHLEDPLQRSSQVLEQFAVDSMTVRRRPGYRPQESGHLKWGLQKVVGRDV